MVCCIFEESLNRAEKRLRRLEEEVRLKVDSKSAFSMDETGFWRIRHSKHDQGDNSEGLPTQPARWNDGNSLRKCE